MGRTARIAVFTLMAVACVLARPASATDVRLGSAFTYAMSDGRVTVAVDEIVNRSTTPSGRLQLWLYASFVKPARGAPVSGSVLASSSLLDALAPGARYTQLTVASQGFTLPRGVWWIVLELTETGSGCPVEGCPRDTLVAETRAAFGAPLPAHALENPAPGSYQSGIGVISGWSCEGPLFAMIDGRTPTIVLPWGSRRADTVAACGGAIANGFAVLLNYNTLGAGMHSIVLYLGGNDGAPLGDPVFFTVTVPMGEFATGLAKTIVVPDFPSPGRSTTLIWQESQQNFAIKSVTP